MAGLGPAMRAIAAVALLLVLAGCLGDGGDGGDGQDGPLVAGAVDADWALRALPNKGTDDGHDHNDPAQHHDLSTPNFQVLGWDPLVTDYHHEPSGGYSCGTVVDTADRQIAVYSSFTTDVAMLVVDVGDAAKPTLVGELVLPLTHVYDASVTDDGRFALLATDPLDKGPDLPPTASAGAATYTVRPTWRDACGRETQGPESNLPYASGLVLVDLRDPTAPAVIGYEPQPVLGAHSVSAATIDGTTYVVASTTNLVHGASYYVFYTLQENPVLPQLAPYGVFTAQYPGVEGFQGGAGAELNGHVDATIAKHPVTGQVLAYLANWNGGMGIVELAGEGRIVPVGCGTTTTRPAAAR